jgi:hypothetical protein
MASIPAAATAFACSGKLAASRPPSTMSAVFILTMIGKSRPTLGRARATASLMMRARFSAEPPHLSSRRLV